MAIPQTIWLMPSRMERTASTKAPVIPSRTPASTPPSGEPMRKVPNAPPKAPLSIMPSRPMLYTPERSESTPPIAAKAMGIVRRRLVRSMSVIDAGSSQSAMLQLLVAEGRLGRAALGKNFAPPGVAEPQRQAGSNENDDETLDGVDDGAVD